MIKFNSVLFMLLLISCSASTESDGGEVVTDSVAITDSLVIEEPLFCNETVLVGASQTGEYLDMLHDKKVGVVGNQSSMIGDVHLVDSLLGLGIDVVKVFSPEHGFRGTADAGEQVNNEVDDKTGLPIISLYGKNKKPYDEQLEEVDVLVFDIQDVGVRFYTYISTLHYIMEAAAENGKEVLVLDRPNPNGHYVDGPVLKEGFTSFVGMHQVPVVHGMTVGEYATMINNEKWLAGGLTCELNVVTCQNYDHTMFYELPTAPSPNLPNMMSVYHYPSLCFFEGTIVSIGRGTDYPFQIVGHPYYKLDSSATQYEFVPTPNGGAKHPKLENETCYGIDLHSVDIRELREKGELDLSLLVAFYENLSIGDDFFLENNFIDLLAGSSDLRNQILAGESIDTIRASWQADLTDFKVKRKQYLLYAE